MIGAKKVIDVGIEDTLSICDATSLIRALSLVYHLLLHARWFLHRCNFGKKDATRVVVAHSIG